MGAATVAAKLEVAAAAAAAAVVVVAADDDGVSLEDRVVATAGACDNLPACKRQRDYRQQRVSHEGMQDSKCLRALAH